MKYICDKRDKTLTPHHSYEEVQLLHCVAEGSSDQSRPCQATTGYDDWTTAKSVHKDAADWAYSKKKKSGQKVLNKQEMTRAEE